MSENYWRPMETAPVDGTEVIVCLKRESWQPKSLVTVARFLNGGWQRGNEYFMKPIAWMPYPEPVTIIEVPQ